MQAATAISRQTLVTQLAPPPSAPAPHRKNNRAAKMSGAAFSHSVQLSADTYIRVYGRVLASGSRIVIPGYAGLTQATQRGLVDSEIKVMAPHHHCVFPRRKSR